jgi:hypothetical protein
MVIMQNPKRKIMNRPEPSDDWLEPEESHAIAKWLD